MNRSDLSGEGTINTVSGRGLIDDVIAISVLAAATVDPRGASGRGAPKWSPIENRPPPELQEG